MPSDLRLQSEQSPARRTFLGALNISAVMALLKNLGGGVEAAPRLTGLVGFIPPPPPGVYTTACSSSPDTKSGMLTPRL